MDDYKLEGVPPILLAQHIERPVLRRLAGSGAFSRGTSYFEGGHVRSLEESNGKVLAKVVGNETYRVRLWAEGKELGYECSCPYAGDGGCCKHVVAVGLAVLAGQTAPKRAAAKKSVLTIDGVRKFLLARPAEELVELLMDRAEWDDELRELLFLRAATDTSRSLNTDAIRDAIDRAVAIDDYVDYRGARSYVAGVDDVIVSLRKLHASGHSAEALDLVEHAMRGLEQAINQIDHSDGEAGGALASLGELHYEICLAIKPEPAALAAKLFQWETTSDWETFYGAASTYADVLKKRGLAEYRRLAEAKWASVKTLGPGDKDDERFGRRFRITSIMEALAREEGDVEAVARVLKKDLSSPYQHLKIAELYRDAGHHDRACEWAERGMKMDPKRPDGRLRVFLADEYHRAKRGDEAMTLVWQEFEGRPGLENFKLLKKHAERTKAWAAWREKALARLREKPSSDGMWGRRDRSTLVEIFLWEKKVDEAWAEAKAGGCSDALWLELARAREKSHPSDAADVYLARVEPALAHSGNQSYEDVVRLLRRAEPLLLKVGRERDFATALADVRMRHARKRNLMRLLDRARWHHP